MDAQETKPVKKPEGFTIYMDKEKLLRKLAPDKALQVIWDIFRYADTGILPEYEGDPLTEVVFLAIQNDVDKSFKKYRELCKRNTENGSKGGRPPKQMSSES